ncbi:hypothetical protein BDQ12DRAFT_719064 [Crucibulum laeve]|uniref:Uncharacterized protein n=1 Tax=Crucibulum laeve TaxID=68775 RepID=A0A5C3MGW0_9AGAR|nr:hypothetical protein BDQ12DRAFT_719064 [Crucibulum laeve]
MALLTPLYNLPNHVIEKQKHYQNSHKPIMLRGPRGRLYVGVYGVAFTAGVAGTVFSLYQLVKGKQD